jgi:hypothetical protein
MTGSTAKIVPEINLDEFEKRLRAAGAPSAGAEDPLAELTRLVNAVHADARRAARGPQTEASAALPSVDEAPEVVPPPAPPARAEPPSFKPQPSLKAPQPSTAPPVFASGLRPAFSEPETVFSEEEEPPLPPDVALASQEPPARRARGWGFKVAGMIVVGAALLAGATALKHGVPGLAKAPPFIAADDAPTKVQPPSEANVQSNSDIASLLMKDSATATPVKVVNSEEQPIDLRTQTQPTPAPSAPAAAPAVAGANPGSTIDSASPVGAAPDTPIVPPAADSASVAPLFPAAKAVKTVSVRPDGTLIAAASPAAAASPDAAPTPPAKVAVRAIDPVVATPEAATPKLDLPTKLSPKSQQRAVAKTDTTAPDADSSATPSAPMQLVSPPRPVKRAADASAAPAPAGDGAAAPAAADAPAVVAAAEPSAETDGEWAVQLAAPRSEADARSAIAKFKKKYADELGDNALTIHQAEVKGAAIFRVRVSRLSKSDASALCSKLKADGSDCFVAKD